MKAFPKLSNSYKDQRTDCEVYQYDDEGMGLRDYFAAKAMQGILANPSHKDSDERIVKDAWKIADQMMEVRQ